MKTVLAKTLIGVGLLCAAALALCAILELLQPAPVSAVFAMVTPP